MSGASRASGGPPGPPPAPPRPPGPVPLRSPSRLTLRTASLPPCARMASLSLRRASSRRSRRPTNQPTLKPDTTAPTTNAATEDVTSRFTDTSPARSSERLARKSPVQSPKPEVLAPDTSCSNVALVPGLRKMQEPSGAHPQYGSWLPIQFFMHPEYSWQRATGTRTTQRGKAASRPPEAASSSRLRSRCPHSPALLGRPHLSGR